MKFADLGRVVGASAYELAVQQGYEGTLEEWLEGLKYDHSEEYKQLTEIIEKAKEEIVKGKADISEGLQSIKNTISNFDSGIKEEKEAALDEIEEYATKDVQAFTDYVAVQKMLANQSIDNHVAAKKTEIDTYTESKHDDLDAYTNNLKDSLPADYTKLNNDLSTLSESMTEIKEDLNDISNTVDSIARYDKWNKVEDCEIIIRGFYNNANQTVGNPLVMTETDSYVTYKSKIKGGKNYYLLTETFALNNHATGYNTKEVARFVCYTDSEDKFISGASFPTSPITVPDNAEYIYISSATTDGKAVTSVSDSNIGYVWVTENGINDHSDKIVEGEFLKKATEQRFVQAMRKPTFAFIFDDGTDWDVFTKQLFDKYSLKCGFAIVTNATEEAYARYLEFQKQGFEILSHSVNGTAFNSITDLDTVENYLKNSLSTLKSKGFDVSGWVTPSTVLNENQFSLLCKYYEYGFGFLYKGSWQNHYISKMFQTDVRQIERWSLESNTVEQTMAKINECISENGFMCFYGHGYPSSSNNMTEANMKTILDFLTEKASDGIVELLTPKQAIQNYFSTRYSDLMELYNK